MKINWITFKDAFDIALKSFVSYIDRITIKKIY